MKAKYWCEINNDLVSRGVDVSRVTCGVTYAYIGDTGTSSG